MKATVAIVNGVRVTTLTAGSDEPVENAQGVQQRVATVQAHHDSIGKSLEKAFADLKKKSENR